METLEKQLNAAGLAVYGKCDRLGSDNANLLSESVLLMDMTPQEIDTLGQFMLRIHAQAGQVLITEGETGEWMLLLLKGTVEVTKRIEPRASDDSLTPTQSRIAVIQCGAAVGEMSMLDSAPRNASCTAIEEVEAAALGRQEITMLIKHHPAVGSKLLLKINQIMAQRLRSMSYQLMKLMKT